MDLLWDERFWEIQPVQYSLIQKGPLKLFTTALDEFQRTGFLGPFGGPTPLKILFSPERLNEVRDLLHEFEMVGIQNGRLGLQFRLPPTGFYPFHDSLLDVLLPAMGWKLQFSDFNSYRNLNGMEIESLTRNRLRDLKAWNAIGYRYTEMDKDVSGVYRCIERNRLSKGIKPGVTLELVKILLERIPHAISIHSIRIQDKIVAGAIALHLDSDILHVYMWAGENVINESNSSPLTTLYIELTKFCLRNNFKILCLGVSSIGGNPNLGLIKFKESLGAVNTFRHTYQKEVNA